MKNGHNPNYEQKKLLSSDGKNWKEWLIINEYVDHYVFRHKKTDEVLKIPKSKK